MGKCVYKERRTFAKYDEKHLIVYLNEKVVKGYQPKNIDNKGEKPYDGFEYDGPETDGGTIIKCDKPGSRDDMIDAVIRTRYSISEELAIHRHHANDNAATYSAEWMEYNAFCEEAKTIVDGWLK